MNDKHTIPVQHELIPHRDMGYSTEQAYARAFNEANHLKHTPFELEPKRERNESKND